MVYLLVFLAGGAGAALRLWVDSWIKTLVLKLWQVSMPLGTFFINATGSFLLGLLTGLLASGVTSTPGVETFVITENLTLVLGVGFLGGYTTFSTAMLEALRAPGKLATGVLALGQLLVSTLAALAGLALGALF
ncbi:fluoride efflux transporter FluC [Rothia nasimurium]|uniref:fluoride efflux transporter FluC n=1 Tax=Rothia nasimurium TaxID=85336 RepID=UPI001F029C56|nr:CrcB family protein [Rothia nasimurium]